MRYFVTGATGFIGGAVARQLREAGHEVVALVRDPARAADLAALGAELVEGDIVDAASLRGPMAGADGVFHIAAWYKVGVRGSGDKAERINVEGTRNVLRAMKEAGVPRGVYTSTLAVFSDTRGESPGESYRFDGKHLSRYDETKWRAHYEVALPMIEEGLPLIIVMPGLVYGPGDTSQMGAFFREYARGGTVMAPAGLHYAWTHVDDIARAHILAMEKGAAGETYIIAGPGHPLSDALDIVARTTGRKTRTLWSPPAVSRALAGVMAIVERVLPVPERFASETLRVTAGTTYLGENSKARRELGYAPRSLEEGMRQTIEEYLREGRPAASDRP
jgi:nucleoside-diphosphate-sugar epimerase